MNTEYLRGKEDGLQTAERILLNYKKPNPKVISRAVVTGVDPDSNSVLDAVKVDIIREVNEVMSHENYKEVE